MNKKSLSSFLGFSLGPIGAALINFITIPVTTWLVSPDEFGKTSIFLILQTLATAFVFLGLDQAYMREYHSKTNKSALAFQCSSISFIFSILVTLSIIFFMDLIIEFTSIERNILLVFALWLPFITIERFILLFYRMEERGLIYSISTILTKISILLFTIIFLNTLQRDYVTIIMAVGLGQIASIVILIFYFIKDNFKNKSFEKNWFNFSELKPLFSFGLPFVPTALLIWFLNSTDRLVLENLGDYHQLGVYLAALKVIGVIAIFRDIFANYFLPIAYRWNSQDVKKDSFEKVIKTVTVFMTTIFLTVVLFKEMFVIILSSKYVDVIYIIPFLVLFPIMFTLAEATGLGISFSRKTHINIYISLFLAFFNAIFCLLIVGKLGAIGISISIGVTYTLYLFIRSYVSRKLWFKFKVKYLLMYSSLMLVIACANLVLPIKVSYLLNGVTLLTVILVNMNMYKEYVYLILSYKTKKVADQ